MSSDVRVSSQGGEQNGASSRGCALKESNAAAVQSVTGYVMDVGRCDEPCNGCPVTRIHLAVYLYETKKVECFSFRGSEFVAGPMVREGDSVTIHLRDSSGTVTGIAIDFAKRLDKRRST